MRWLPPPEPTSLFFLSTTPARLLWRCFARRIVCVRAGIAEVTVPDGLHTWRFIIVARRRNVAVGGVVGEVSWSWHDGGSVAYGGC